VDLAIIDPRLPDMDGNRCLHTLREQQSGLRILLLNAAHGEPDRVTRAAAGEHWVSKPFSLEEVLLKVRVMLRRTGVQLLSNQAELVAGDLVLDEDSREVVRGGDVVHLSYMEFELLRFFVRNTNRVVTKRQILGHVWPYDFAGRSSVVELYVSYLRKKVDARGTPLIHTLRRAGYIFKPSVS
jgi:two-component system OmpR family response regulator